MINEVFGWQNGKMYLSRDHIKNMKRNMRKVPIIQIKSDLYHNKEETEAENILNKVEDLKNHLTERSEYPNENNKVGLLKIILGKIKNLFKL